MNQRVRITDVAARDGLQNEPGVAPIADKVRLIQALAAAGVDEIEIASFVSPRGFRSWRTRKTWWTR